ncbi:SH3 domain-containing protein [Bosea sp. NPDC003192]|uniref:SH3 domain-containing protein n=1 Tax=Bosea sp. NPDC003192 TaxID=3390551 RepID=UPI003D00FFE3
MIRPALFALFGLLLHGGEAQASLFCLVPETGDGFVALRAAPSAQGRLILRMRAGDEVQIVEGGRGGWSKVRHWPGDARLAKGYDRFTEGHVARRFLKECG